MTVYVIRDGALVPKGKPPREGPGPRFPAPHVSRMAAFESPVTGKTISSWHERDRDMTAAGAVDPRDLPRTPFAQRRAQDERSRNTEAEWDGLPAGTGTKTKPA